MIQIAKLIIISNIKSLNQSTFKIKRKSKQRAFRTMIEYFFAASRFEYFDIIKIKKPKGSLSPN